MSSETCLAGRKVIFNYTVEDRKGYLNGPNAYCKWWIQKVDGVDVETLPENKPFGYNGKALGWDEFSPSEEIQFKPEALISICGRCFGNPNRKCDLDWLTARDLNAQND